MSCYLNLKSNLLIPLQSQLIDSQQREGKMMEEFQEGRMGKRRHRRKCKRRKRAPLNKDQFKGLLSLNSDDKFWDVVKVVEILNKVKGPKLYDARCSQWLTTGNNTHSLLEEFFSPHCVHVLCQVNSQILRIIDTKLRRLLARIGRIRVRRILNDHIPGHKGRKCAHLITHPLERRQLCAFVTRLYALFFHDELLDKVNMERLCENISAVFTDFRSRGFTMSRAQISKGIQFDRICWLKGLHFQLKKTIMLNVLKSLLNLFTHIFTSFFYSTLNFAGRIVHYRRDVWRRICSENFDLLRAERQLQLVVPNDQGLPVTDDRIHRLIFLPKKRTVRPIVILRNASVKHKLNDVRAVLQFIIRRHPILYGWGISNIRLFAFAFRRLTLQHTRGQQKDQRMHFCTADVQNCYTSLEHQILDGILHKIIRAESKFVVVSVQVTSKLYRYRRTKTVAGISFADAYSRHSCKDNEELSSSPCESQINGAELLRMIRQYAMQTVIREPKCALTSTANGRHFRQRLFVGGRGIAQGNSLSVALCNLYLGSVERQIFPERPPEVFCRRYMDDYLLMADRKEQIEQLVATLLDEMPKFGLRFGKVVVSFPQTQLSQTKELKSKDKLQWCGLAINQRTLSLTVDYRRYRRCHPSISLPSVQSSEHFHFICSAIKRALSGRMVLFRNCARVWSAKRRASLRRDFCRFAYSHYLSYIVRNFGLDPRDVFVRDYLSQLSKYVWNGFRKRSLPSQLASAFISKGPVTIFQI